MNLVFDDNISELDAFILEHVGISAHQIVRGTTPRAVHVTTNTEWYHMRFGMHRASSASEFQEVYLGMCTELPTNLRYIWLRDPGNVFTFAHEMVHALIGTEVQHKRRFWKELDRLHDALSWPREKARYK